MWRWNTADRWICVREVTVSLNMNTRCLMRKLLARLCGHRDMEMKQNKWDEARRKERGNPPLWGHCGCFVLVRVSLGLGLVLKSKIILFQTLSPEVLFPNSLWDSFNQWASFTDVCLFNLSSKRKIEWEKNWKKKNHASDSWRVQSEALL